MERLQKVIASSGLASRRKAEELIKEGKVKVNGEVVTELGIKVSSSDDISVMGNAISREDKVYYLLNKPRGVVTTTSDDKKRTTVIDLINESKRIYPVGRLDYDTTGALILTNDGELTNLLTHPSNEIEKVYVAKIKGRLSIQSQMALKKGVVIDGKKTAPARLKIKSQDNKTDTSLIELTIHEGRNHQVKDMFSAVGHEVIKLKRDRISFLDLKGLSSGKYRSLTPKEVKKLYFIGQNKKDIE